MDSSCLLTTYAAVIGFFTLLVTLFFMLYTKFRFRQNNQTANSFRSSLSLLSPPSSLPSNWIYNVFPSFHGPDTRKSFLSHLMKEFNSKGITAFIDNEIKRGEFIGPELIEAINGSRIAIVLLSTGYASSSWCLDELLKIMKGKEELGRTVMTIFYKVDPTDVKKQTGDFGKFFRKTCAGKKPEVIGRWRQALAIVATIAGYHSNSWDDEAAMIEKIAADISKMLNHLVPSHDFDHLIGMEAHMERMEPLLRLDLNEVRMIGIWGPPGIGKSTIARFLFHQLSSSFQLKAIMEDIRVHYPRPCRNEYSAQLQLQNEMWSKMIKHEETITHLGVAEERLKDKKVLLVLDDVDRLAQLHALAEKVQWFGPGSRIIITTEDLGVLNKHWINHIYKVDFPSADEALQIFCMHAFDQKFPKDGFAELAHLVTYSARKLPLGLKVLGSYFRGMSKQEWTRALPKLWSRLDGDIESILKFSYDALCDVDKDLFLHIACFFNYGQIRKVEAHLAKKFASQGLDVLAKKSLISIYQGRIEMHGLLVQLGKEIVRKQSDPEPGQRQFLVDGEDISEVLTNPDPEPISVIGISGYIKPGNYLNISETAFKRMSNLKFLRLFDDIGHPNIESSSELLKDISPKLQLLQWDSSPMTCLPFTSNLKFLVELIMSGSMLEKLWEGTKLLQNLKWMDLSHSKYLKELPDLSTATNLQELDLSECSSLVELPFSLGNATNLQNLNLNGCSSLMELPSSIGNATNLQELDFGGCSSLVELPFSLGNATSLQKLYLGECSSLKELPSWFGNATNNQYLNLEGCSSLKELPSSIGNATNLQILDLIGCSSLVELPFSLGNATNLQNLNLEGCSSLKELPSSIGNATNLQNLNLEGCSSLKELPSSIGNATNLQNLDLEGCSSLKELPSSIGNATNLKRLHLVECSSLKELPSSIGNATNLQNLNLEGCSSLKELPSSIGNATILQNLNLNGCSSLVELPSSIGNLHRLIRFDLEKCSKLEVLPTNINLESLNELNLTNCSSLKSFPEISTNIKSLKLSGTAIEVVPLSIKSWSSLEELHMPYCENLKKSSHVLDSITELHLINTEIQALGPWVEGCSRLRRLKLRECGNLVSLSELPKSLAVLDAENCVSLERLDCSFHNPDICLNFGNCFKLNQKARYLIIKTSTSKFSVLPGVKVPACFTHKASGSSVTVKLNEKHLHTPTKFKACFWLSNIDEDNIRCSVKCNITPKQNGLTRSYGFFLKKFLSKNLYIFDIEAEVTSTELVFEFKLDPYHYTWRIRESGILHLASSPLYIKRRQLVSISANGPKSPSS